MIRTKHHRSQLTNRFKHVDRVSPDGEPHTIIYREIVQSYTLRWRERRGKHHTIVVRTVDVRDVNRA